MAQIKALATRSMAIKQREARTLWQREEKKIAMQIKNEPIIEDEFNGVEDNDIILPKDFSQSELTNLVTIFRQRREWEKKSALFEDANFDHILTDGDIAEKISQFLTIIRAERVWTMKKFFAQIRPFFADSSDQYFVLKILLQRHNIAHELKVKFKTALTFLEKSFDKKILKSGVNTALKTRYFSAQLKIRPAILRASYRKFLENEKEVLDIYYDWIVQFGYNKRRIILEFMENALVTDIMSSDPSCSKNEFGNLLGLIKQINLLYSAENILEMQIKSNELLWQLNPDELNWFQFFYFVIKSPQSLTAEINLLVGKGLPFLTHRQRGAVLQHIYQLFLRLPLELFTNFELKEKLKHNFTRLMDISFKHESIMTKDEKKACR